MKLQSTRTKLKRAGDVEIPAAFFQRMRTGYPRIDEMLGGGILPGSTIVMDAVGGTGKTTFWFQVCQTLAQQKYDVGYLSGEERVEMLSMSCKRLKTEDVMIAAENRLSEILKDIEHNDLLVIDSFPSIEYDLDDMEEHSDKKLEDLKLKLIIKAAQEHECAVVFILHVTKTGTYKGATDLNHDPDVHLQLAHIKDMPDVRLFRAKKNRLGPTGEEVFNFGVTGFDFETQVELDEGADDAAKPKRQGRNALDQQSIMEMKEPPEITMQRVCEELDVDGQRARWLLGALTDAGRLEKFGRGKDATWKKIIKDVEGGDDE